MPLAARTHAGTGWRLSLRMAPVTLEIRIRHGLRDLHRLGAGRCAVGEQDDIHLWKRDFNRNISGHFRSYALGVCWRHPVIYPLALLACPQLRHRWSWIGWKLIFIWLHLTLTSDVAVHGPTWETSHIHLKCNRCKQYAVHWLHTWPIHIRETQFLRPGIMYRI